MFHHIAWAMKAETPDALSRWLLVVLADHTNEDGKCWPSQATLAKRTGMGRSTVNRKLEMLEEAGLISRVSGNQTRSTVYYLLVPERDNLVPERDKVVPERDTKLPINNNTLTEEWEPSEKLVNDINLIAHKSNQEIDHVIETAKFIAYHQSNGRKIKNTTAAYKRWCLNTITFAKRDGARQTSGRQSFPSADEHGRRWRSFISSAGNKNQ